MDELIVTARITLKYKKTFVMQHMKKDHNAGFIY